MTSVASSFMAASSSTSTSLDSPKQQECVALSSVSGVPHACCKCFMWMLHILPWLYMYVASVLFQMF
jgi:hypothetical protein